ncbi:hypothetical protein FPV67DRAFT_1454802 [Lyophyllum atratum]|nr:hypothetical protein FPV67DRAFT_1454802 [Lyophyllum atratum]
MSDWTIKSSMGRSSADKPRRNRSTLATPSSRGQTLITAADADAAPDDAMGPVTVKYQDAIQRLGKWCYFCTDPISEPWYRACSNCGALICLAKDEGGAGCIAPNSVKSDVPFRCHVCVGKGLLPARVPYTLAGQGVLHGAKLTWPLVYVPITLKGLDSPAVEITTTTIKAEYRATPETLFHWPIEMSGVVARGGDPKSEEAVEFIRASSSQKLPPNLIIVVDTHSHSYSGRLQVTKTTGLHSTVAELLTAKVGTGVFDEMRKASDKARRWNAIEIVELDGGRLRADVTPLTRGGLACPHPPSLWGSRHCPLELDQGEGPGGTGKPGSPRRIFRTISTRSVKESDLWGVVKRVLTQNTKCVEGNSMVAAFKKSGNLVVWEAAEDSPQRPFGLTPTRCGKIDCSARGQRTQMTGETKLDGDVPKARFKCLACAWTSKWVRPQDIKEYIFSVEKRYAPSLYYHAYPLHPKLDAAFYL